jgi:hypothetical protein
LRPGPWTFNSFRATKGPGLGIRANIEVKTLDIALIILPHIKWPFDPLLHYLEAFYTSQRAIYVFENNLKEIVTVCIP